MDVRRLRPYATVLVAGAIVAWLPSHESDSGAASTRAAAGREAASVPDAANVAASVAGGGGGAPGGIGGARSSSVVAPRRPGATGAAATPGASAGQATDGAGIGTPAALAAPDCDPNTKRLKVSFVYAPPCAVAWPKGADNGGATSLGVTKDTIKVLVYLSSSETTTESDALSQMQDAAAPYEHLFRMWGRHVEYSTFRATGPDEVAQRADAIKIADLKPFALINVLSNQFILEAELARKGIITINNAFVSVKDSLNSAPYIWGTILHPDELVALNTATYVGRRLWGRPARWAGQAEYQVTPRKFGLIYPDTWDGGSLEIFTKAFSSYGAKLTDAISYRYGTTSDGIASWNERARLVVSKFKNQGVTSVIAGTDFIFLTPLTKEASSQQWFPEWVMTGFAGQDLDTFARAFDQLQWQHAFGIGALGMFGVPPTPGGHFCLWYWGAGTSHDCTSRLATSYVQHLYTGLHGAGPHLTPQTFRDGMFALMPAGGSASNGVMAPQMSFGQWGFFPWDNYNAYNDFAEAWWDPTAQGRDSATGVESVGKYRYLDNGLRHLPLQWPATEPAMFSTQGTALYWQDYPPGDRPPDYPCPGCPSTGG